MDALDPASSDKAIGSIAIRRSASSAPGGDLLAQEAIIEFALEVTLSPHPLHSLKRKLLGLLRQVLMKRVTPGGEIERRVFDPDLDVRQIEHVVFCPRSNRKASRDPGKG